MYFILASTKCDLKLIVSVNELDYMVSIPLTESHHHISYDF